MVERRPPHRVLCIKLKHIGDVLLMTAAIRAVRRAWPSSRVAALVPRGTEGVLEGNPDLDAIFSLDRGGGIPGDLRIIQTMRRYAPDVVLEMGGGDREAVLGWLSGARLRVGVAPRGSGQWRRLLLTRTVPWGGRRHTVEMNLDMAGALGIDTRDCRPVLVVQPETRTRMVTRLESLGAAAGRPLVVVHPVSRWLFKAWPEAGCAETIAAMVRRRMAIVAVTSGPEEREAETAHRIVARAAVPVINLVGQTTLTELAAVLERAALFVGVDSAPMHMAAALGVPVVALFGPSGEHHWGPWGEGHVVVAGQYLCRPCGRDGCLGSKRSYCLEAISAETVLRAVERALHRSGAGEERG
jgi:heptosyltransferase-3